MRSQLPIFEAKLIDEEAQVNGYIMLIDCTGITLQLQTFFGLDRMTRSKDTNVGSTVFFFFVLILFCFLLFCFVFYTPACLGRSGAYSVLP